MNNAQIDWVVCAPLPVFVGVGGGSVLEHRVYLQRHHVFLSAQNRSNNMVHNGDTYGV